MKLTKAVLVLVAFTAICMSGTLAMAQRGGGGRPGGGFGGGFGGGNGVLDIARRPEVQAHLELLKEQIDDLNALAEAQRSGQRERFAGLDFGALRNGTEAERTAAREKMQAVMSKAAAETQAKVDEILLPHQSKRLSQLAMQRRLRGGVSGAFGSEELSAQLGISNRERAELVEKARKAGEALSAKMAELRDEMQADLLKNLSPAQQAKYKALIGDPFEFAQDERGPGGRGGQPGGGRQGGGRPTGGTRGQRPAQ